ncbi:conserved hypothetical protein [Theileria orientalis strain Shintoku]|uniref:Uncharacterized protein n=1 Tax=Theileria orientalis strain Shintoku TaxID=869250 RepID=J4C386_THEOR|nr:conserved hypothetical protein [Theileria orientalis strain Shintoku]BAM40006.1 conserved hypothetical protein [Theileria orientalis strain Shintoku]|eukprot:XP_009690307.1 conserved hypothetical protein [Theileria orientalis strain Shintoku]
MSNTNLYDRKISGKIKLKGISKLYKKKKKEDEKSQSLDSKKHSNVINELTGSGRIVSSGTTVQGFETKFAEESSVNDKIVIEHPMTHATEERTIQSILSNRTINIDEPFSVDVITTIPYNIRKITEDSEANVLGEEYAKKLDKKESSTISIREKTGMWSYKNVTKTVKGRLTAEDKLNERVKQSRDKYCW